MLKELGDSHSGWSVQSTYCESLRSHSVLKSHSGVGYYVLNFNFSVIIYFHISFYRQKSQGYGDSHNIMHNISVELQTS